MSVDRVDGRLFEAAARGGLARLRRYETELNRLNVFPVADGDTGTNMRLTLENGIRRAASSTNLGQYLTELSGGMLLGARGNSGVILSQIFRGVQLGVGDAESADSKLFAKALAAGVKTAYEAVIRPVEGTILTVVREGAAAAGQASANAAPDEMLAGMIDEMQYSLERTPDLLPVLREMGVVDSGAKGFIVLTEGMLAGLRGETEELPELREEALEKAPDFSAFTENSRLEEGYCMEFILQRLSDPAYEQSFLLKEYISELEKLGNSLVAVEDGSRVKVHVHTHRPAPVIFLSQRYGEFLTFKLENMQLQHNEYTREKTEKKAGPAEKVPLAVIACANGPGIAEVFSGLGCAAILDGGPTMNTSAQEFVDAILNHPADAWVLLPNNSNVIRAAEQAAELSGMPNVTVLPSRTQAEGYYALAMDIQDSRDIPLRLQQMRTGMESIDTVEVAYASRDYCRGGLTITEGTPLAVVNGEVAASGKTPAEAMVNGIMSLPNAEEKETFILFAGAETDEKSEAAVSMELTRAFPTVETALLNGGQPVYHWIVGVI